MDSNPKASSSTFEQTLQPTHQLVADEEDVSPIMDSDSKESSSAYEQTPQPTNQFDADEEDVSPIMDSKAKASSSAFEQTPQSTHQLDADEEDENVKQLGDCSMLYLSLQDCLVNTNRNWKACQKEVQALKACNERRNLRK